ncbi:MAG: glutamate--cysteine ligase, partial [Methylococcales bacterium]|nr:glutamate--cysteine ligase [Methylococcales bacterium]
MKYPEFDRRLKALQDQNPVDLLRDSLIGIEKESLRVNAEGSIAATPHPEGLGKALT